MTGTRERAVAAMRALGDTVDGAPPLHLPARDAMARAPRARRRSRLNGRAWRVWAVPVAAALAVVAVAVSLVLVRSASTGPEASPGAVAPGTSLGPGGVPPYYVALPVYGWYAYAPVTGTGGPGAGNSGAGALTVGATATGKRVATVAAPHGLTFNVVTGAADDRTFVVGATTATVPPVNHATWSETWYLLQLDPGGAHPARLTTLPVPPVSNVTGAALSPDGGELAVSFSQVSGPAKAPANGPAGLTVWSTVSGQELRHWAAPQGQVTTAKPAAAFTSDAAESDTLSTALRWSADGGQLGFAWNGAQIRLLDLTSPASTQGDLVKASTLRAVTATGYTPGGTSTTCEPGGGWALSASATVLTCAGSYTPATGAACPQSAPAHPAFIQRIALGGGATEVKTVAQSPACMGTDSRGVGAALGWSSADGSTFVGQLSDGTPGYEQTPGGAQYGVFADGTFTKLPALLAGEGPVSVAW